MSRKDPRHGGILSAIFFAIAMVILGVVIAGMILSRSIHVQKTETGAGENIAIDTPGGRLSIRSHDHMSPAALGIPIYPGAKRTEDQGGASFSWTSKDGLDEKGLYVFGGSYRTPDSVASVVDYYRREFPALMVINERDKSTRLEYKEGGVKRIVSIRDDHGETRIGIASVGGRESN